MVQVILCKDVWLLPLELGKYPEKYHNLSVWLTNLIYKETYWP